MAIPTPSAAPGTPTVLTPEEQLAHDVERVSTNVGRLVGGVFALNVAGYQAVNLASTGWAAAGKTVNTATQSVSSFASTTKDWGKSSMQNTWERMGGSTPVEWTGRDKWFSRAQVHIVRYFCLVADICFLRSGLNIIFSL